MNDEMINVLFLSEECGFKNRFVKRLKEWKNGSINSDVISPEIPKEPYPKSPNTSDNISLQSQEDLTGKNDAFEESVINIEDLKIINYMSMLFKFTTDFSVQKIFYLIFLFDFLEEFSIFNIQKLLFFFRNSLNC